MRSPDLKSPSSNLQQWQQTWKSCAFLKTSRDLLKVVLCERGSRSTAGCDLEKSWRAALSADVKVPLHRAISGLRVTQFFSGSLLGNAPHLETIMISNPVFLPVGQLKYQKRLLEA